jgi:hypothetical protein
MKIVNRSDHVIGRRFGLGPEEIFRLWKTAIKDDEGLLDDAITATYDRMLRLDPKRAEQVMSLIIRRHSGAREALHDLLM